MRKMVTLTLPELDDLARIVERFNGAARLETLARIPFLGREYPIPIVKLGPEDPASAPTLVLVGGVHGVERIGSQVILSYLHTLSSYLRWDEVTAGILSRARLVVIPIVNPTGVLLQTRANQSGVDLMRNAPVDSGERTSRWRIYRGHRISPRLPWYRGEGGKMEPEAQALCDAIRRDAFSSPVTLSVDVHSGYGTMDRIWFPFARSRAAFPRLAELKALKRLMDDALPHHVYRVEPQSSQYTTHGDLWDHLFEEHSAAHPSNVFLPITLEMGSWVWLKKNPFQVLSPLGLFHPVRPHRVRRVLRRHWPLLDFLLRATHAPGRWTSLLEDDRQRLIELASSHWGAPASE